MKSLLFNLLLWFHQGQLDTVDVSAHSAKAPIEEVGYSSKESIVERIEEYDSKHALEEEDILPELGDPLDRFWMPPVLPMARPSYTCPIPQVNPPSVTNVNP
jgi:hypothetical protein